MIQQKFEHTSQDLSSRLQEKEQVSQSVVLRIDPFLRINVFLRIDHRYVMH